MEVIKILIADDDENIRLLLSNILKNQGYDVLLAKNGKEALELISQHPDIRLLITDLMMAVMDGVQLTQTIRSRPDAAYIYIIMMTANAAETSIIDGVEAGVDEFLFKPLNFDELLLRVSASASLIELKNAHQKNQLALQQAYDKIHADLQIAAKMQRAMLPDKGKIQNFAFDWFFYPSDYVAGDAFSYFSINPRYIGFYQVDVAGHGVSSAMLSMILHHQLAKNSLDHNLLALRPGKILQQLNEDFSSPDVSQYFTITYGCIEISSGKIRLSQAGHPHPIHLKSDGSLVSYDIGGLPIGMFEQAEYEELEIMLELGDRLFIYSDGVTECESRTGEQFSEEGLLAFLTEKQALNLDELLCAIEDKLLDWHGSNIFNDDTTLLAIERLKY